MCNCCCNPTFPDSTFPVTIEKICLRHQSWDFTMDVDYIWNAIPRSVDDILAIVNWCAQKGWIVRATGAKFTWFPGLVSDLKASNQKLILMDMTKYITNVDSPNVENLTIRCQTGAMTGAVLSKLDVVGLTLTSYPADGHLSVGGIITAGSHGSVCTDVDNGPNPHGSLANMVSELTAVVYDDASKQYVTRTFQRDTPEGRAYLISFGRIILVDVTIRVMKQYNCRCLTTVEKDLDKVFVKPTDENPTPEGSFAYRALKSGRYSALTMPAVGTVWHRDVFPCAEKPESSTEIKKAYSFPYMATVPLWQQSLVQNSMGVPADSFAELLAQELGPKSHKGVMEETAEAFADGVQRFENAFGITDLLQKTTDMTAYITKATVKLSSWLHNNADAWGKSQNIMLCVENTMRMRSFCVVVHTSKDKLQSVASTCMEVIRTSLQEEAKNGHYPVALPVEFRASSLDDDVASGAPMLSFIRKDAACEQNGWDIAMAIEVVHFPKTYGVNSYMTKLENVLVAHPALSGTNARVVGNWGKPFAYSQAGPWHSQRRMDVLRRENPDWNTAVHLINAADPKNVTNNSICQWVLQSTGAGELETDKNVNNRLPWDVKWGEDEPTCGQACCRFWCCCCTD